MGPPYAAGSRYDGSRTHSVPPFRLGALNCWENWMPLPRAALHAQCARFDDVGTIDDAEHLFDVLLDDQHGEAVLPVQGPEQSLSTVVVEAHAILIRAGGALLVFG